MDWKITSEEHPPFGADVLLLVGGFPIIIQSYSNVEYHNSIVRQSEFYMVITYPWEEGDSDAR